MFPEIKVICKCGNSIVILAHGRAPSFLLLSSLRRDKYFREFHQCSSCAPNKGRRGGGLKTNIDWRRYGKRAKRWILIANCTNTSSILHRSNSISQSKKYLPTSETCRENFLCKPYNALYVSIRIFQRCSSDLRNRIPSRMRGDMAGYTRVPKTWRLAFFTSENALLHTMHASVEEIRVATNELYLMRRVSRRFYQFLTGDVCTYVRSNMFRHRGNDTNFVKR